MYLHRLLVAAVVLLVFSTTVVVVESARCDDFSFTGTDEEYSFTKLSVVGFSASVSYVELPAGEF